MPTTYNHYRFGQEVLASLNPEVSRPIRQYKELFDAGLHGPDLLFYYHALTGSDVIRLGNRLHHKSGLFFFSHMAGEIKAMAQPGPSLAYLYGFLCHFALDRRCHAYIEPFIEESGVSHFEIEAEQDRYYLQRDGKNPFRQKLTGHIVPSLKNARVMAPFFDWTADLIETKPDEEPLRITPEIMRTAMKSFRLYLNILVCRSRLKRNTLLKLLEMVGHKEFADLIIHENPNPACEKSNQDMDQLYALSVTDAVRLIEDYVPCLKGEKPWDEIYSYNFEGEAVAAEGE